MEGQTETLAPAMEQDDLFLEAARIVIQTQRCAISLLQRELKIGYSRAGKLVDLLEQQGVVTPFDNKPREVLVDQSWLEQLEAGGEAAGAPATELDDTPDEEDEKLAATEDVAEPAATDPEAEESEEQAQAAEAEEQEETDPPEEPEEDEEPEKPEGPPPAATRDYQDLVQELLDLQEMTHTRGWRTVFGQLLDARDNAKTCLLTAEKMNDVIRMQSTAKLVDEQIQRLLEPVERINELREKYPLFESEFQYSAELDKKTGRITVVTHTPRPVVENNPEEPANPPGEVDSDPAVAQPRAGEPASEEEQESSPDGGDAHEDEVTNDQGAGGDEEGTLDPFGD